MNNQIRIEFRKSLPHQSMRQERYLLASVLLGKFREDVQCNITEWNKHDYLAHWEKSYDLLKTGGRLVMFCSSLDESSVDLWVAGIRKSNVEIINLIANREDVHINKHLVRSEKIEALYFEVVKEKEISSWKINV